MNKLTLENVNDFAKKNNIILNNEELDFTYKFVKKNWAAVLANPNMLNLDRYKDKFSEENLIKIKKLFKEYSIRFKNYL
jgi:uncharacterized FlgJ-related protein